MGWRYRACHIWDKGLGHKAGNANSKTLRGFPVVTEVCVQYVRTVQITTNSTTIPLKEWVSHEWDRTGIPLHKANDACRVRNAASRKYLTRCHLWNFPPPEAFAALAQYANEYGHPQGRPYYSLDGQTPATAPEWALMRAKFHCDVGITNAWRHQPLRGAERIKNAHKPIHLNKKPIELIEMLIRASSDPGDVVWVPFGGLCTAVAAAINTDRRCFTSEHNPLYYEAALDRLRPHRMTGKPPPKQVVP